MEIKLELGSLDLLYFHWFSFFWGGKGDGPADASKVKAFGPGLEKGKVQPGVPTNFTIDSSKTGPATIDVDILGEKINIIFFFTELCIKIFNSVWMKKKLQTKYLN